MGSSRGNRSNPCLLLVCSWALSMLLTACGGGGSSDPATTSPTPTPPAPTPPVAVSDVVATFPFKSQAAQASDLRPCTYNGSDTTLACPLARLPFLGQERSNPSIDDIMDRVLVSHGWMGENFELLLRRLPGDLPLLLRSVTAIVIAADIRPAHYRSSTGAIYLDPEFLWITPEQEADIIADPDPRLGFGPDLQVRLPWRFVRQGERLTLALNGDGSRNVDSLAVVLGFLLYHELAHAVDFMAPSRFAEANANLSRTAASFTQDRSEHLSRALVAEMPLESQVLTGLAAVSFLGSEATDAQNAITANELVSPFSGDGAIQYYGYSTTFEDFATLFETIMMRFHFGYEKDTGITTAADSGASADGIVAWGQRGRLTDPAVFQRTLRIGQLAWPGDLAEFEAFLNRLGSPQQLQVGVRWGDTQQATTSSAQTAPRKALSGLIVDDILERRAIR